MVKIPSAQELGLAPSATPQSPLGPQSINVPDMSIAAQQLSGLGRAMSRMFESAAEAQIFHQKIEDERILMENESKLADLRREALYGEGGLISRQLGDAIGATDDAGLLMPQWRDMLQSEGLSEAGRDAMEQYLSREEDNMLDVVARHELNERSAHRKAMLKEQADKAEKDAQFYFADPEALAETAAAIRSYHVAAIDYEGADPPSRKEMEEEAERRADAQIAGMYERAILRATAEGGDSYARTLLTAVADEGIIDATRASELLAVVANGERETVVQHYAQGIWDASGENLELAMTMADQLTIDGDAKKDLKAELDRRSTRAATIRTQQQQQLEDGALYLALNGDLDSLSREQLLLMDDATVARLRDINVGIPVSRTPESDALFNRLYAMTDAELGEVPVDEFTGYGTQLPRDQYDLLAGKWRSAREGKLTAQRAANEQVANRNRAALKDAVTLFTRRYDLQPEDSATLTMLVHEWADAQDAPPTRAEINAKMTELSVHSLSVPWATDRTVVDYEQKLAARTDTDPTDYAELSGLAQSRRQAAIEAAAAAGYTASKLTVRQLLAVVALQDAGNPVTKANVKTLLAAQE